MYNIFVIEGEPSDGTYMYRYVASMTVLAIDKQTAIQYASHKDMLLGDSSKWTVTEHLLDSPGIVDYSYTQDY